MNISKYLGLLDMSRCDPDDIAKFAKKFDEQIIINFLNELNILKYTEKCYLLAEISTPQSRWSNDNIYVPLNLSNFEKFERLIKNYNNVALSGVPIGNFTIQDISIIRMANCEGPPTHRNCNYGRKIASPAQIEMLEQIPDSPKYYFKTNKELGRRKMENQITLTFNATEPKMRALFDFQIYMDKINYLSYMDYPLELEAGRGNKWYLRVKSSSKELIKIFINNAGCEKDSSNHDSHK